MDGLAQDLRFALRGLGKAPGFTSVVVLTLALGIGATTGVFSALHAVLLASLPYPEPDRLVFGIATFKERTTGLSAHDHFDFRDQATSFESLGANLQYALRLTVTGGDRPENVNATFSSVDLFPTLGVSPVLGRHFTAEEGKPGPVVGQNEPTPLPPVALISHSYWQRRFGGAHTVLGETLTLAGDPVTVVGVMPAGFRFLMDVDVWLPMRLNGPAAGLRRFHNWVQVGRLRKGVTIDQAQAEVTAIARRLEKTYPESNADVGLRLRGLHEALVARLRPQVLLIMAAVALLLLIACGNVANLLLARGITRRSEMAMRAALGASRGRLVRQLVTESTVLALAGGALGLVVAGVLQRLLPTLLGLGGSRLGVTSLPIDLRVLAFAAAVSLATGVGVGLLPALRSTRVSLSDELKASTRTVTSRGGARFRMALVAAQVTLSLVLLVGSALLVRSFARLVGVDLGFDPRNVLTAELALPGAVDDEVAARFFDGVLADLRALPGVAAAGMTTRLPILHGGGSTQVWTPEHPEKRSFSQQALGRRVLPGYFGAMRMPLVAGRDIEETDRTGTPTVMVVNETMARSLFPGENPVGRKVVVDTGDTQPVIFDVVGVVADAKLNSLDEEPLFTMYLSYYQYPSGRMNVVLRSTVDPQGVTRALREIVERRDRNVPVEELATMEGIVEDSTLAQRALTATVTSFSVLSLLLAAIGLFGVQAYQVNQRQHELGIRMALGALHRHVLATVLRQGLTVTGAGLGAGLVVGLALTRLMSGLLFEVAPTDPASFAGAAACLLVVSLAACLAPALRALRIQPITALRYE